jgi:two-component system phosphate regulon response regulator OmpR
MDHIIIAERNPSFAFPLIAQLTEAGFRVDHVLSPFALARMLSVGEPDLLVIDAQLSSDPAELTVRQLRANHPRMIIMVIADAPTDIDRIVGLESGADEFTSKSPHIRLMVARVRALLRRKPEPEHPAAPGDERVCFGKCELDLAARQLMLEGQPVRLSTSKFAMLKVLVRNPRRPLSREVLMQQLRGREFEPFDRSLDVQVAKLRKLVEPDPANPRFIQTVRNLGYMFVPGPGASA